MCAIEQMAQYPVIVREETKTDQKEEENGEE